MSHCVPECTLVNWRTYRYDLCNEPDDQYNWPGSLYVEDQGNRTLNELHPAASAKVGGWGDYEKAQCGGWSTTFDPEHCGQIEGPILPSLRKSHPGLVAGFQAMSDIFGACGKFK